jgi:hypothetical protein
MLEEETGKEFKRLEAAAVGRCVEGRALATW